MSKDIYRNKIDFAREEFETELPSTRQGMPKPRETRSQIVGNGEGQTLRKDRKIPMKNKLS